MAPALDRLVLLVPLPQPPPRAGYRAPVGTYRPRDFNTEFLVAVPARIPVFPPTASRRAAA